MPILSGRSTASLLVLGDATVAPYNVVKPYITASGAVVEGTVLTRTNGTWKGALPITTSPQWTRNGVHIDGATSNTYTVVAADVGTAITCEVTATNNYGSNTSVASNSFTPQPSIPTGSIIMYNGVDPTAAGWSRYSAADGLYIQGTATQAEIATTVAASGTLSATYTLGTTGAHTSANLMYVDSSVNSGFNSNMDPISAGDHTHTGSASVTLTTARPYTTELTLLIATTNQAEFPANTIHMRDSSTTGWTQKVAATATRNIRGGASGVADVNRVTPTGSGTTSSSGAHTHIGPNVKVGTASTQTGNTKSITSTAGQAHTHTLTATGFVNNMLSKALKLWIAASQNTALTGDMVMFAGTLTDLPSYWKVCDGNNGTVDMQAYFLGYSNSSATAHGTVVNKSVTATASTSTNTWTHEHGTGTTATNIYTSAMYHTSTSISHSHTVGVNGITDTYVAPTIKLAFIQYVPA